MKITLEQRVLIRIASAGFGSPQCEYRFHPTRKWRFDFAFPDKMIAVECEGGVWTSGRHTRGSGFIGDAEKYNEAAILGWRILKYTTSTLRNIREDLERIMS